MADNTIPQVETPTESTSAVDEPTQDKSTEVAELKAQLEEMSKRFNGLQSALSKEQEAKKAVEAAAEKEKLDKMSTVERLELAVEKERAERERWQREAVIKENTGMAKDFLHKNNLPESMLSMMDVSSKEGLDASFEKARSIADEIRSSVAGDFASKYGQPAPHTGTGGVDTVVPRSYKEAKTKEEKIAFLQAQRGN
jgi:hypothetical protein